LVDLGFAAGWGLGGVLPDGVTRPVFRGAADLAARRDGAGIRQLRQNLARVVPDADEAELTELVRAGMRSYARYWREAFQLPAMDAAEVAAEIDDCVTGREHLENALAAGKGVVLGLPHSGNWDAIGVWLVAVSGDRFTTVAERLKPESVYQRFLAYRESLGFEIVPLTGGTRPPTTVLLDRLRDNHIVALLGDRDLTSTGVPVTFFGEQTRMPAGPAYLAAKTGAVLLPLGLWFTESGWGVRVHPAIPVERTLDIGRATQELADAFAADIADHPADWHMLQKLWISDLPEDEARSLARGYGRREG
jgi:KDO2-lipid IV(A) lauroyltransferase